MADESNSMQGSMGLNYGPPQPMINPTAPISIPITRHPGEVSVDLANQTNALAMQTRTNVTVLSNPMAAMGVGPMNTPAGAFGSQYAAAHAAITGNYMSGYGAGMYGMGPVPGLNAGMLPSAGGLTDPMYGIYRSRMSGSSGFNAFPTIPRESLFRGPFGLPDPMYSSPAEYASDLGMVRGAQYQGAISSAAGAVGRLGVGLAGGSYGTAIGAALGAAFGGPLGAKIGGFAGGIAGMQIADSTLGEGVQRVMENNPLVNLAQRAGQIQGISTAFVTTGSDVSSSGRGLGYGSAVDVARYIQRQGYAETTGFNAADLTKIMDQGGQVGLFDSTQSVSDIKSRVMSVANVLRQFMQITNDPDVTNAIKELGNMRNMGLSLNEAVSAAQNSRMYAKAAGTSIQALSAAGQTGAYTYQMQGLSAGLGMQVGNAATASARQAVASGTYSEEQLNLLGGVSGIAQRQMETSASMLKMPMLASAMSRVGPGGTFGLDTDAVKRLMAGEIGVNDLANMSARNLSEANLKIGAGALGMFQTQQTELQDQLGRVMGPTGLEMAPFNIVNRTMRDMGLAATPENFAMAAGILYQGDQQMVKDLVQRASNPEYFRAKLQAMNQEELERGSEMFVREQGYTKANTPAPNFVRKLFRPIGDYLFRSTGLEDAFDGLSRDITNLAQDYTDVGVGKYNYRLGAGAIPETAAQRNNVMAPLGSGRDFREVALASEDMRRAASGQAEMGMFDMEPTAAYVRRKSGRAYTGFAGMLEGLRDYAHGVDAKALGQQAADFSAAGAAMDDIYDTAPEQRQAAFGSLSTAYGDASAARRAQDSYRADFQALAQSKAAGPIERFLFESTGGLLGKGDQAATAAEIRALDERYGGETAGRVFRMSMGRDLMYGVDNQAYTDRESASGAVASQYLTNLGRAQRTQTDKMAEQLFGTDPQSRHTQLMQRLFVDNTDPDVAALSGMVQLTRSGTDYERAQARDAMSRYQQEIGIAASDPRMQLAQASAEMLSREPDSELSLRELGAAAIKQSPTELRETYAGASEQMRAYMRLMNEKAALSDMIQSQVKAGDREALTQAMMVGGPTEVAAVAQARGGAVFRDGSTVAADFRRYQEAIAAGQSATEAGEAFGAAVVENYKPSRSGSATGFQDTSMGPGSAAISATGSAMADIFPAAVQTFQEASNRMLQAANALQGAVTRGGRANTIQMSFGP